MSTLKKFSASASLLVAVFLAAPVALAEDVIVFDAARVFAETKGGKDLQTKVSNIEASMQAELKPEGQAIQTEKTAFDAKRNGKTPEQIQADTALVAQGNSLIRKMQTFQNKTNKRARELAATERTALALFAQKMRESTEKVRAKHNAKLVFDLSNVYIAVPGVDVTQEVISQMDQDAPSITVQQIKLNDPPASPAQ